MLSKTQHFINRSSKIHDNFYTYEKTLYGKTNNDKVIITCPIHSNFLQRPRNHISGQGCPKCKYDKIRRNSKNVINEFIETHGNEYSYEKFVFKGMTTKGEIICYKHGPFLQTPHDHIHGNGCPKCGLEKQKTDFFTWKNRCKEKHNNKYSYDKNNPEEFHLQKKAIITCPIHGDFEQFANNHMSGHECFKCSYNDDRTENIRKDTKYFITKSNGIHNEFYGYTKTEYTLTHKKVIITCPIHGDFKQTPANHLQGQGCPKCKYQGVYTEHFFKERPEKKSIPGIFYLVLFQNDDELFHKIGITSRTVKERFRSKKGYNIESLLEVQGSLYHIFQLEQRIKKEFYSKKYAPSRKIGGDTECFIFDETELNLIPRLLQEELDPLVQVHANAS